MANILLIGNGAREHAIAEAIKRSRENPRLFAYMKSNNPGIAALSEKVLIGSYSDLKSICNFARDCNIQIAVIGPEDPLNNGVADALGTVDVPCFGPTKSLARLETSKSFTRNLLDKYGIPGNPRFAVFERADGIKDFLAELDGIVIKPDGLTAGKGVRVQGDHFQTKDEAYKYCLEILSGKSAVIIEEKLNGEEFSLQCITDGMTVLATPPVQDHKRRFDDDKGPNTGGMGSYSCEDHLLPFLSPADVEAGLEITRRVAEAIHRETGEFYKGIMYGGFIITRDGVKLLEYNARFGDPEAMNVLPILLTDFVDICRAVVQGNLHDVKAEFARKATVCKYLVPKGYGLPADHPDAGSTSAKVEIGNTGVAHLYYASVDQRTDGLYMSTSRAIGVVGIADDIEAAEKIAEEAVKAVSGPISHRPDIGTSSLLQKRVKHMKEIRG